MRSTGHREVVNTYFEPFSFMVILAGGRMRDVCLIESAVGYESLAEKVRLFLCLEVKQIIGKLDSGPQMSLQLNLER